MSRNSKWKLEKNKVKVVFRLQFHATHIPQSGWDKLFISFIPVDTGKATAKTTKANVRNGMCKWGDPIYETTRLLQDSNTKQFDEKLYKIVVSMGSSRASILGEAIVNLADYIDALKPSTVALPLSGCSFGTIIHLTVQLLTSKTGFREFEQQRELREKGFRSGNSSGGDTSGKPYSDEITNDKASPRVKLKTDSSELSSVDEEVNFHEDYADSNSGAGFDGSSNTSGSLYAEKQDNEGFRGNIPSEIHTVPHSQSPGSEKGDLSDLQHSTREISVHTNVLDSNRSIDHELAVACEENTRLRESLEVAESSFSNLKLEVNSLQGLADELGIETQKLSHLLVSEKSNSEELAIEVSNMKSECFKFKEDIVKLKDLKVNSRTIMEASDSQVQVLKGIDSVEGKIREMLNNRPVSYDDRKASFIYLELEALFKMVQDVKHGTGELRASENGFGLDLCQPQSILQHFDVIPSVSEVNNPTGAIDVMKGQILDLVRELDDAKVEKEALIQKMHQMECYYEALILDLEENQKLVIGELQLLRNEHSTCLYTLSASRAEMESMHENMNHQILKLADERRDLETLNMELERRATTSEAALRRARLNYSIAVDKLQKDLELLSSQVVSMFETNESLIKQAFVESLEDDNAEMLPQYPNPNMGLRKISGNRDVILEDLKRSFYLQEELCRKAEEDFIEMLSLNLNLDVYSNALQQSLLEATADGRNMKQKMDELLEELEISTASQNQLMAKLQNATEDIHVLNEYKSNCISQFSDMALQNQILEDKVKTVSAENWILAEKLKDLDVMVREYQSKYEASSSENAELSLLVKQETSEKEKLQAEMVLVKEKLAILTAESDDIFSSKKVLEENNNSARDKLANLLVSYSKQFGVTCNSRDVDDTGSCMEDAILRLEEIQKNACTKIAELTKENQGLESERDVANASLSSARSEILATKQKFNYEMQSMVAKLNVSSALVGKLQSELESVANKLQFSSEIEEEHAKQNKLLLADLAVLEDQMHELMCNGGHLSRDISGLHSLAENLERGNSTIVELMRDKQDLLTSLQDETEKSVKLESKIGSLEEDLRNVHDELHNVKSFKDELEEKLRDLSSQFEKDSDKFAISLKEKTEESVKLAAEMDCLKEDLRNLQAELHSKKVNSDEVERKFSDLTSQLNKDNDELVASLQVKTEECIKLASEIDRLKEDLRNLQDELDNRSDLTSQLNRGKDELAVSLQVKTEESLKLAAEIDCLKANLIILQEELDKEKACKDEMVGKVRDLNSQLNEKDVRLSNSEQREAEVLHVTKLVSDLELEKSRLANHLEEQTVLVEKLQEEIQDKQEISMSLQDKSAESIKLASEIDHLKEDVRNLHDELRKEKECKDELERKVTDLTSQLNEGDDVLFSLEQQKVELLRATKLASDLELEKAELDRVLQKQKLSMETLQKEISCQASQLLDLHDYSLAADIKLVYLSNQYEAVLQKRHLDLEAASDQCSATETHWNDEKSALLTTVNGLRSDLEGSTAQKELLLASNNVIRDQFEECKRKLETTEEEISMLYVSKEELEIVVLVLKGKVSEKSAGLASLEEHTEELMKLRSRCDELSRKLSEQVLRTEEFKNLSTHLKALKDKAEAECIQIREKREEGPSVAAQDSLRVAFIKEQYETKFQELTHQLAISKRHGEEMLLKLQDSINEIENRKKSEAVNSKKNEELALKLLDLETELQAVLTDKRERINAYDRTKAELECALLSLECCKEEKEKLENSLHEFREEKFGHANEIDLLREQLEELKSSTNAREDECKLNGLTGNSLQGILDREGTMSEVKREYGESADPTDPMHLQIVEDATSEGTHQIPEVLMGDSPKSTMKKLDVNGDCAGGAQMLRSSMDHLHEQLEKMKQENLMLDNDYDSQDFHISERQLMQLQKANEELRSMFPSFNDISGGGNALESVLALEMELAEALKTKNKRNTQFQSSFLKQHSNEEAVLKSFRDINELIKEMLELKGKNENVEAELREMHDRYSQLSLQFAEVEGERQKLKMTLKNVRSSRKLLRSSSSDISP